MTLLLLLLGTLSFASSQCGNIVHDSTQRNNFGAWNQVSTDLQKEIMILGARQITYQDGPNCFNAALVGKGYLDEIAYTSSAEFAFFIHRFCQPKTGSEKPGDLLTLQDDGTYMHGALALGNGQIFEKRGLWGRNMPAEKPSDGINMPPSANILKQEEQERFDDSRYVTHGRKDSYYLNPQTRSALGDPPPQEQDYSCLPKKMVQASLNELYTLPVSASIRSLNKEMEPLFLKKETPQISADQIARIEKIAELLQGTSPEGEKSLFALTSAWSLQGSLSNLLTDISKPSQALSKAMDDLSSAIKSQELKERKKPTSLTDQLFHEHEEYGSRS